MNGRAINVEHAELRTATVTVKALTIDKRQVTLAVFRQLKEEDLVSEAGEFKGLPWGTVNYCPNKKECGKGQHLHVVWQQGTELRHALERAPSQLSDYLWPEHQTTSDWLILALNEGFVPSEGSQSRDSYGSYVRLRFVEDLPAITVTLRKKFGVWGYLRGPEIEKRAEEIRDQGHTLETLLEAIRDDIRSQHRTWVRLNERWSELCALDQLFIAT